MTTKYKKPTSHIDYSKHMPHLDFTYDEDYYPRNHELPDPQIDPVIPGAHIKIDKVGVSGVDLPVKFLRRDGTVQELHASVSLYGSLDNPEAKGLNLSRFPITMHEEIADHISIEGMKKILKRLQDAQGSSSIYCKMKFKYPWVQEALRTRKRLPNVRPDGSSWLESDPEVFMVDDGKVWSHEKEVGHIFYDCVLESQLHGDELKFYLTVNYIYSSTCPCSTELAQHAISIRGKAANGHSQRSIAKITVQFNPDDPVYIEDVVEMARTQVPTEVVIICRRVDEQAFAERNGSNLVFTEDAIRLFYQGVDKMFNEGKVLDFSIVTDHLESLHPWNATAVTSKGISGGLR